MHCGLRQSDTLSGESGGKTAALQLRYEMSHECCEGVRGLNFSRRYFLKQGGIALVGMSAMPAFLQRAAAATAMPSKKQLVVLFQRGAADGLNIVVPFSEPNYYRLRPTIAIQPGNLSACKGARIRQAACSQPLRPSLLSARL